MIWSDNRNNGNDGDVFFDVNSDSVVTAQRISSLEAARVRGGGIEVSWWLERADGVQRMRVRRREAGAGTSEQWETVDGLTPDPVRGAGRYGVRDPSASEDPLLYRLEIETTDGRLERYGPVEAPAAHRAVSGCQCRYAQAARPAPPVAVVALLFLVLSSACRARYHGTRNPMPAQEPGPSAGARA